MPFWPNPCSTRPPIRAFALERHWTASLPAREQLHRPPFELKLAAVRRLRCLVLLSLDGVRMEHESTVQHLAMKSGSRQREVVSRADLPEVDRTLGALPELLE